MALRKCACIDTLYTELDWLDRFQAAKDDGFEAVEFWDWRIRDLDATREAAQKAGIAISGFNGDADYSLVDPTHKKPYLAYLKQSIDAAKKVGAASVTIHSNALGDGGIVVNHYDVLIFVREHFCQMRSHFASPCYQYLHSAIQFFNKFLIVAYIHLLS